VVRDLPGVAFGIGERTRVAAPEGRRARAGDGRAGRIGLPEDCVHLGGRADVVRQRDPAPAAPVLDAAVLRQLRASPGREDHPASLEEDDVVVRSSVRRPADRLVERSRAAEIAYAERDEADARLHQTTPTTHQARAGRLKEPSGEPTRRWSAAATAAPFSSSSPAACAPTGPAPPATDRQSSSKSR